MVVSRVPFDDHFPTIDAKADIHKDSSGSLSDEGTLITQFVFNIQGLRETKVAVGSGKAPQFDEDGDLVLPRSRKHSHRSESSVVLHIEHALSTPLTDVGQQVWRGALVMSDYILYNRELFEGSTVLELGAGVGMVSIVACLSGAKCVLCTDIGNRVLDICKRNVYRNLQDLELAGDTKICVKELDWRAPLEASSPSPYSWDSQDSKMIESVDFILAADAIYDDSITEAFIWCLVKCVLRIKKPVSIIIALEKRINFTLEHLAPASPAYDFFRQCLDMTFTAESTKIRFELQQIPLSSIPRLSDYERVQELEIWRLNPIII